MKADILDSENFKAITITLYREGGREVLVREYEGDWGQLSGLDPLPIPAEDTVPPPLAAVTLEII
jgi:hypothetical protein